MTNLTSITVDNGIPNSGTGTVSTLDALMADGGQATLGAKADAAAATTDATPISSVSIWKQISKSVQAIALGIAHNASALAGGTPSNYRLLSAAASTNGANIKGTAGRVYGVTGSAHATAPRYIKLYDKATSPTVGSDTPVMTFEVAAFAPFDFSFDGTGHSFAAGIGIAITTAAADADTGICAVGDITSLNVRYA